jgi:hypothetical protein
MELGIGPSAAGVEYKEEDVQDDERCGDELKGARADEACERRVRAREAAP